MPAIRRYDVEITLIRRQVIATSASEALTKVQDDIRVHKEVEVKKVSVERCDLE